MTKKKRIAVSGAGLIGRAHIDLLIKCASCELVAITDPAPAAQELAASLGVPLFGTLEALLRTVQPEGVIIATPNALHAAQATLCIDAGVPILLEKPITATVAEAEALVRRVDATSARVLVGHHRAHSPIMANAKAAIDAGRLGKVVSMMGSAQFFKPDAYFESGPWRREVGGGPILINLIHEIHSLRMLCGEIVVVQAMASNATRGFAVEDTVAINFRFASGALGAFVLSDTAASPRSWEQTAQENQAYSTYPDEDCYVIAGTEGSLHVPTMRLYRYGRIDDRSWWKPFERTQLADSRSAPGADPLANQLEHFGAVVRGEVTSIVSARDGLQNLRVTEAIARAAAQGKTIEIPLGAT
jgi:predicted dehydrogenase